MSEKVTGRRVEFRREQVLTLLKMFGGDNETVITVASGDASSHSGPGLYAYISDYPDEGALFLGPEGEAPGSPVRHSCATCENAGCDAGYVDCPQDRAATLGKAAQG